jgi:NAD-dependent dihydropyrimidine dehydrogenase PreA subunit
MAIMQGAEANRAAPKYQADRALFLLLLTAPYRLRRPSGLDVMAPKATLPRMPSGPVLIKARIPNARRDFIRRGPRRRRPPVVAHVMKCPLCEDCGWVCENQALILVCERGGPTMFGWIGVMRALNRHHVREFNPKRKEPHWGRRKLKRDQ